MNPALDSAVTVLDFPRVVSICVHVRDTYT